MMDADLPIFTYELTVQKEHLDQMQHVNNAVYVQWINDIATLHWEVKTSPELRQRVFWVLIEHQLKYKASAVLGDEILLKTQVGRATNVKYQRFVEIYRKHDMQLLVHSTTDWCALDKNGRPMRISEELRTLFEIS